MSVPKNYRYAFVFRTKSSLIWHRESRDDGILTGVLLGPLIGTACLVLSLRHISNSSDNPLLSGWLVEAPKTLPLSKYHLSAIQAAVLSRYSLVDLGTFCASLLLLHVFASWWWEKRYDDREVKPEGERASVPRSEGLRGWYYILFTLLVSGFMIVLKTAANLHGINLWRCGFFRLLYSFCQSNHTQI